MGNNILEESSNIEIQVIDNDLISGKLWIVFLFLVLYVKWVEIEYQWMNRNQYVKKFLSWSFHKNKIF